MPSAPMLGVDTLPPPFSCSAHGWVVCPLHVYGPAVNEDAVGQSRTSVFEFGGTSSAAEVDADVATPRLPPLTPAVAEMEGHSLAYVSAPTGASSFVFGSDAGESCKPHGCAACRATSASGGELAPHRSGSPEDARRLCGGCPASGQWWERL
ncbi:hypothetical protein D1007_34872 [Hordeum vulgare]|nr:hypothetical protein D1007_34872 [Hordeum vulgare]